ncbi:hypothetical protein AVEN_98021-1 [Araneus ventricosus]|uniref:Uncharacterized protein n=1 Tax=Araneus ventricosus TaxID=182803 RepID=A0A4Y2G4G9_ARAVE|nr:hypothetical protein AVEN_98021-1 [Araneus ventricosus]
MDSSQYRCMIPVVGTKMIGLVGTVTKPDLSSLCFFLGYLEGYLVQDSSRFLFVPGGLNSCRCCNDTRKADLRMFGNSCGVDVVRASGEILNTSCDS